MLEDKNNKEKIDLSDALKNPDKGVKSQDEQQPTTQVFLPGTPKIIQWTIKYSGGLIKSEKQANYVLIGFVVAAIIISLFLVFGGGDFGKGKGRTPVPPGQNIPRTFAQ